MLVVVEYGMPQRFSDRMMYRHCSVCVLKGRFSSHQSKKSFIYACAALQNRGITGVTSHESRCEVENSLDIRLMRTRTYDDVGGPMATSLQTTSSFTAKCLGLSFISFDCHVVMFWIP